MATNSFTYDAAGNLRTLTDGKTQLTSWGYDTYGRVASKTNDSGTEILDYLYDASSKDCSNCFFECMNNGGWPYYKCPK